MKLFVSRSLASLFESDYGRPGLSHITLEGASTGSKEQSLWLQTLSSGVRTPIHHHDCEETFVVLAGEGRVLFRPREGGKVQERRLYANSTLHVPAGLVHQIQGGSVQYLVFLPKPAARVWVHANWTDEEPALRFPYLFDASCPPAAPGLYRAARAALAAALGALRAAWATVRRSILSIHGSGGRVTQSKANHAGASFVGDSVAWLASVYGRRPGPYRP